MQGLSPAVPRHSSLILRIVTDLILSTVVFFAAAWWLRRYLDEQGIPQGMTRNLMVLVIATALSFAASSLLSWLTGQPTADQQVMQMVGNVASMPK